MDWRIYILAGAALLFAVSMIHLFASLARAAARRASLHGRQPVLPPAIVTIEPVAAPRPSGTEGLEDGVAEDLFEPRVSGTGIDAALAEPLRTGDWKPETPGPEEGGGGELTDPLLEDIAPDLRGVAAALDEPVKPPGEGPYRAFRHDGERGHDEEPVRAVTPEPTPPEAAVPTAPQRSAAAEVKELLAELASMGLVLQAAPPAAAVTGSMPPVQPVCVPVPVTFAGYPATMPMGPVGYPAPYMAVQQPVMGYPPAAYPQQVSPPVAQPSQVAPAPVPPPAVPAPAPAPPATVSPEPALAAPAPAAPAPAAPAPPAPPVADPVPPAPPLVSAQVVAPTPAVPVAVAPPPESERPAVVVAPPTVPEARVASATVPPGPSRPHVTLRVASKPVAPDSVHSVPAAEPAREEAPEAADADFELVSPVEMWFGDFRIGVKPGSRTFSEFQRIAGVLFDDLKAAAGAG